MKKVTLADIIDAIEKNGYTQIIGEFIRYDPDDGKTVIGACALGQAALNLDVHPDKLFKAIRYDASDRVVGFTNTIFNMNDFQRLPLPLIAPVLRRKYATSLDELIEIEN